MGILRGYNKGTKCHKFFLALSLLSISVSSSAVAQSAAGAQWYPGGTGGLFARRPTLLPQGDGSGRLHHAGLPAAEPPEDLQGLRSGAQEPRAVSPSTGRARRPASGSRTRPGLRATRIALVLAAYSPIWGSRSRPLARTICRMRHLIPDRCSPFLMTTASELRSGKTHRDENFPVASWIIHRRHRALILAFYNFVRTADDIADHARLGRQREARLSRSAEAELLGKGDTQPEAVNLRGRWRSVRCRRAMRSTC